MGKPNKWEDILYSCMRSTVLQIIIFLSHWFINSVLFQLNIEWQITPKLKSFKNNSHSLSQFLWANNGGAALAGIFVSGPPMRLQSDDGCKWDCLKAFSTHMLSAWSGKTQAFGAWTAGDPWASLFMCKLSTWSPQHGAFRVAGLLTSWLRIPTSLVPRENQMEAFFDLAFEVMQRHFCMLLVQVCAKFTLGRKEGNMNPIYW